MVLIHAVALAFKCVSFPHLPFLYLTGLLETNDLIGGFKALLFMRIKIEVFSVICVEFGDETLLFWVPLMNEYSK